MAEQKIYHEKQSRMLCAVHALNNLFQDPKAFSKAALDEISYNLSPDTYINPHKNLIGLGNYDVNVVMTALSLKGYDAIWFDKRMSPDSLSLENIFGFIINKPSGMKIIGINIAIKRPHWFAIRRIGNNYFNLDSKLPEPSVIGDEEKHVEQCLTLQLQDDIQTEILIVVEKNISESKTWKKSEDK